MPFRIGVFLAVCYLGLLSWSAHARADVPLDHSKYLKQVSLSPAKARDTALREQPGSIVSEELEKERGGSGLRYSFDIRTATATHEVGIDAKTGVLLENSIEGSHPD